MEQQKLILVDIENLARGSTHVAEYAEQIRADLYDLVDVKEQDQVIVASGVRAHPGWAFVWPDASPRIRRGIGGADFELLHELEHVVPGRYSEVVIASGDGVFAKLVRKLGTAGVPVTVVSQAGCCSKKLRRAAKEMITYTPSDNLTVVA
ncbi:MAG: NYN domain-containing protein [Actinomycetaceae bacterium]|nr:NYN domain-containing protein [Actinomycetaceae bacterium]